MSIGVSMQCMYIYIDDCSIDNMSQLAIVYLGLSIFALAIAIVALPTMIYGTKPPRSR